MTNDHRSDTFRGTNNEHMDWAVPQEFGGIWTDKKLAAMRYYFEAYAKALQNQSFRKIYIDAFAGTGSRINRRPDDIEQSDLLFEVSENVSEIKEGSARIALVIEPSFVRYLFIDASKAHVSELHKLRDEFPNRNIEIRHMDANVALKEVAQSTDWRRTRAAIFIDPFGMEVDWSTLEALKETNADIVLLFPTGALSRMTPRHGKITDEWERKIDRFLGDVDWRSSFYRAAPQADLFREKSHGVDKAIDTNGLREFAYRRLSGLFPHVCEKQLPLQLPQGTVLFHLFFICANDSAVAGKIAMRIAKGVIRRAEREWGSSG